jgi:hypothetical protein
MTHSAEDITAEVSLFEIWRQSRRARKPVGNRVARLLGLGFLIVYAVVPWTSTESVVALTRQLSAMGLPALLGLLGFLLAGYTVFISVARRDLLVTMSKVIEAKSGLTWLKVSLYTYVGALAELLVVAALLLAAWILASEGGLVSELVDLDTTGCAKWIVGRTGFVLTAYLFVHTIIVLKVTIRNVHHGIAAAIRWDAENPA